MSPEKVLVTTSALKQVLLALNGPAHYIRELQVLRNPPFGDDNPINILAAEFKAANGAFTAKAEDQKDGPANDDCCSRCQRTEIKQHDDGSASCVGKCEDDVHQQRLKFIYDYSMAALVKPVMTFDEWIIKLDEEIAKNESKSKTD